VIYYEQVVSRNKYFSLLEVLFFFQICDLKILAIFLVFIFFLDFFHFFHFFQQKLQSEENSKPKKKCWWGGGGLIQLFNAKISPNYVVFIYIKEMKVKYILTPLK